MGPRYVQKSLLMIYKMKVPQKGAFMITITIIFLLLKHYVVRQWCISWKLRQISNREIKLEVFPALHIFRSVLKNHCFVLFCHKIALNTPGFSVGYSFISNFSILIKKNINQFRNIWTKIIQENVAHPVPRTLSIQVVVCYKTW